EDDLHVGHPLLQRGAVDAGIDLIGNGQGADRHRVSATGRLRCRTVPHRTVYRKGYRKYRTRGPSFPLVRRHVHLYRGPDWLLRARRKRLPRLSFVVALVGLAVAGFAPTNRQPATTAQESSQPAIVGAWFVTTLLDNQPPSPNMTRL